jgi:hypothetical protein
MPRNEKPSFDRNYLATALRLDAILFGLAPAKANRRLLQVSPRAQRPASGAEVHEGASKGPERGNGCRRSRRHPPSLGA